MTAPDAGSARRGGGASTAPASERGRRVYRSTRRRQQAEQTREVVVAAATSLFAGQGWAATGMRDVAKAAGVSVETVYANFGSKGDLLVAAIDRGVVGDAEATGLSARPEFAALAEGGLADRVVAAARLVTGINERTCGLRRALHEAARNEPMLAEKLTELETSRRETLRAGMALVAGGPLADDVLDALWVVTDANAFDLLTRTGGRSVAGYERWLAETMRGLVDVDSGR